MLLTTMPAFAKPGILGVDFKVGIKSFSFNTTLKVIVITKTYPGEPAQLAGIAKGDMILEINGKCIDGAKANDIKPYLDKEAGQVVGF
jgi:C-terminal processing protease CtpA/Prc